MRWSITAAIFIAALAGGYFVYPYWTIEQMQAAVEAYDAERLASFIDWESVRADMKAQAREAKPGAMPVAMADQIIDGALSADALDRLYANLRSSGKPHGAPKATNEGFLSPLTFAVEFERPAWMPEAYPALVVELRFSGSGWKVARLRMNTAQGLAFAPGVQP